MHRHGGDPISEAKCTSDPLPATPQFTFAALVASGCSSKAVYGGMIGAGVGGLSGNASSGMLIGAGIGGLIDAMDQERAAPLRAPAQPRPPAPGPDYSHSIVAGGLLDTS